MPFIEQDNQDVGRFVTLPEVDDIEAEAPSVGETFSAAFKQENSFVSAAANGFGLSPGFQPEEGYDPYEQEDITGYEVFAESFIDSRSKAETMNIKSKLDQELEDRKTLSSAGFTGFVAQMAAGITDPIYLPLMASGIGVFKIGSSAAKAFGKTAGLGAISEIPAEAAKMATQETRTIEESLINIGGAAFLSGLMGAGVAKLSKKEFDDLSSKAQDILVDEPGVSGGNLSMGAAEVAQHTLGDLELVNVGKLEQWGVSPLVRTSVSDSLETRTITNQMMETPLITKGNIQGIATAPEGGSVETRIKLWDAPLVKSLETMNELYLKYRNIDASGLMGGTKGNAKRVVNDYVMRNRQGKLTPQEFRIEVGKAMRRGDQHFVPEVAQAAASFRSNLFDPLKDAAIEGGLLPRDVSTATAVSYLTRVYRTDKIIAKSDQLDSITLKWLEGIRAESREGAEELIKKASAIVEDAKFDPEDIISSLATVGRKARVVADEAQASLDIQVGDIKEIRNSIEGLKKTFEQVGKQLDSATTKEKVIQDELLTLFKRLAKFKPDEGAKEFKAAVGKTQKQAEKLDAAISKLSVRESTLRKEAENQLTRFLSDRARGLEKREKAFGQSFVRIERELTEIRKNLSGKKAQRDELISKLEAQVKALKPLKQGSKERTAELQVSITRLKVKAKRATDAVDKQSEKFADLAGDIKLNRQVLSEAVATRVKTEGELKTSSATASAIASKLEQGGLSDLELGQIVVQVRENITGVASGRVPYDIKIAERGPMKERTFSIDDELIEDFLESDIDIIARQYKRTMAPDVELNRMFGDLTGETTVTSIERSYALLTKAAKTEKERTRINNKLQADKRDLQAMWDRLRGTYRMPEDPNAFFTRAGKTLRDVNFLRMLGGMTLSAIPDLARPIAVNGLRPVARALRALAIAPKEFKMSRLEAKKAAIGLDMVLNSRAASMAEITDIYARGTPFERGLQSMSDGFSKLTLMSQWNASLKQFSGVVTQDRMLGDAVKWSTGDLKIGDIRRMAAAGINQSMAKRIAEQFKRHGDDGDLRLSNGDKWDDREALETFRAAILKDVDRTIITPGAGEKPLWSSSETGKLIFQFKTFASAAHHKILLADLQHRDLQALNGFLISVALGSMTYGLKNYVAGREIPTDPTKLVIESLDRSGAFGYLWDINNMIEKGTRGNFGVNPLVGAPPMSRYASRNITGAMLGPSLGTVEDVIQIAGGAASGEFTQKELRRMRQMLPAQNLFYIRRLLNELERGIGEELPK